MCGRFAEQANFPSLSGGLTKAAAIETLYKDGNCRYDDESGPRKTPFFRFINDFLGLKKSSSSLSSSLRSSLFFLPRPHQQQNQLSSPVRFRLASFSLTFGIVIFIRILVVVAAALLL